MTINRKQEFLAAALESSIDKNSDDVALLMRVVVSRGKGLVAYVPRDITIVERWG